VIYLLSYFRTQDDSLYYAASEDRLAWTALNENRPILQATVGNCSIRDPFIDGRWGAAESSDLLQ
jgi:hypothetical protein